MKQRDPAKIVGYVRAGTDDQSLGPEAQRHSLEAYCLAHDAFPVSIHEDIGYSGGLALDKRFGLLAALASLDEHKAGVFLVAKRDRLARDVVVAGMVERLVERVGAKLLSADGTGNGDGPEQGLLKNIVAAFAEYERALIRERTGQIPCGDKRHIVLGRRPERHCGLHGLLVYVHDGNASHELDLWLRSYKVPAAGDVVRRC
jgi:hypothetical protein